MCREGAWAELTVEVTFMGGIQSGMHGKREVRAATLDDVAAFFIS